jgi:hypothetical protein
MRLAALIWLFVSLGAIVATSAPEEKPTPTPPVDAKVIFRVSINGHGNEFHMGERIPITLSFSSKVKDHYRLDQATYDRSGRMNHENFTVDPAPGAMDPLAKYFSNGVFAGGGLTNFSLLSEEPWTIDLNLNEWLRFTKPGVYKLTVWSERVEATDVSSSSGTHPITSQSNVLTLKILPRDQEWEKRVYDEAVTALKKASPKDFDDRNPAAFRAIETLRFLGTADATRELAKQICGSASKNNDCYLGLIASPERAAAREAFGQVLSDPDIPVTHNAISVMQEIEGLEDLEHRREEETKVLEKIVDALPNKKGGALSTSLDEVFSYVQSDGAVSKQKLHWLGTQLLALFEFLPIDEQQSVIEYRWDADQNTDLLPILKRVAQRDLSNISPTEKEKVASLARSAWHRWQELDPGGARQALAEDMKQLHPRLSGLIEPSDTAPPRESDQALLEHFLAMNEFDPSSEFTTPIAQYGTPAILPQVLKKFDGHQGIWDCYPDEDILAFILRVDPAAAKPRIEKTIAERRSRDSGCTRTLSDIAKYKYDPTLEEIAIRELDDPNFEMAADAAQTLEAYGSPAAEAPLWRRYESWAKSCEGHEEELNVAYHKEESNEEGNKVGFGRSLYNALAKGRGWVADYAKLKRLVEMTKLRVVPIEAERFMEDWNETPLKLRVYSCPPALDAGICQYHFRSMDVLKEKLSQFPWDATFVIEPSDDKAKQCADEIRGFLVGKGNTVVERSSPTP